MHTPDQLLQITKDLMRLRSTATRPEEIERCAQYVADFFADSGLTVERFLFNNVPSIVVTKGTKTPKIFLSGHLDVVEGDDDQFEPRVEGPKLYGRGALDMKSGDAVLMAIMKDLAATSHDVGLMLTGDEEVGGFNGVGTLTKQGYSCQAVVIPDGGLAVHHIVEKEKGVLRVLLTANGKASHGSTPWKGDNAIILLMETLTKIQTIFVPLDQHAVDHWMTTINIGKMDGGDAVNRVPSKATALCDIRYTEQDKPDDLVRKMESLLPEGVTLEKMMCEPMTSVSFDHPLVIAFQDAIRGEGRIPERTRAHGGSDGRFFSVQGIPVIISQPDGANLHAQNEWVDIPSIETYYKTVLRYLDLVAK